MNTIHVTGMSCQHCKAAVETALGELGLTDIAVNLESGQVTYRGEADREALGAAIDEAGFELA